MNQLENILQAVDALLHLPQFLTGKAFQDCLDGRKHLQGIAERDKIPGVRRLVGDLAQQPFQVVDRI